VPGHNNHQDTTTPGASHRHDAIRKALGRVRRMCLRLGRGKPILRLEAHNVGDRDAIEMSANSPGGKKSRVDELVDGLPVELPPAAQLRYCQPGGTRIRRYSTHSGRVHSALCRRWMRRTFATHGCPISCAVVATRRAIVTRRNAHTHIVAGNTRRIRPMAKLLLTPKFTPIDARGEPKLYFLVEPKLTRERTNKVSLTPNFELEKPLGFSCHGPLTVNSRQVRRPDEHGA
jgi:hypothetical protein